MNIIDEHDLLVLDSLHLDVWKCGMSESNSCIAVCYHGAEILDGNFLRAGFGRGNSIDEAMNDYYRQIKGKTLVVKAFSDSDRKEYRVL